MNPAYEINVKLGFTRMSFKDTMVQCRSHRTQNPKAIQSHESVYKCADVSILDLGL